eukprot:jgi/Chrzof1/12524/Cz06g37100.t1
MTHHFARQHRRFKARHWHRRHGKHPQYVQKSIHRGRFHPVCAYKQQQLCLAGLVHNLSDSQSLHLKCSSQQQLGTLQQLGLPGHVHSWDDQSMQPKFCSQQQLGSLQQLGRQSPVVQSTGCVHPLLDGLEFTQQQMEQLALSSYPALVYDLVKQYPMRDLLQQHGAECLVADSHFADDDVDWHLGSAMFDAGWLDDHVDLPSVPCKHPSLFKVSDPAVATSAQVLSDADWQCSPLGPWIDQVKSAWPLKSDAFRQVFSHDQDCEFLFKVVEQGVPISDCFSSQPAFHCKNYEITPALWPAAAASFEEQLKLKEVVTPPTGVASPFVHSIAAIPKQGKLDRARIIHDVSRPSGCCSE